MAKRPGYLTEKPDLRGTVKWFNAEKGYGFITGDDGQDIFLYHSHANFIPQMGDRVHYKSVEDNRRKRTYAVEVVLEG